MNEMKSEPWWSAGCRYVGADYETVEWTQVSGEKSYCLICGGPAPCETHTFHGGEGQIGHWGKAPAELRPPAEHADKPLHWLEKDGKPLAATWSGNWWHCVDTGPASHQGDPNYMAKEGYRYLALAEYGHTPYDPDSQFVTVLRNEDNEKNKLLRSQQEQIGALICERDQLRRAGLVSGDLMSELLAGKDREIRDLRRLLSRVEDAPTDPVQCDIDRTIDHLLNGRTTKDQRKGLSTATERAERVKPDADVAVGRALR